MVNNNTLISLREIRFGYPSRALLFEDLNFTLRAGDRVGIIGPNGCGKTTLLYIIMGLIKANHGLIKILGREMQVESDFKEVRKQIGFLFQNSDDQLFCPTVKEEVGFGPLNLGIDRPIVREMIKDTLTLVGLKGFEDRVPYQLSAGEKRKLALATVFATNPKILLLDEPTNGLDNETVEKIVEILNSPELSYIIISQNREFLRMTTRIIYTITNGEITDHQPK